jgi:uncharacterized protein YecE (DUF72 family)
MPDTADLFAEAHPQPIHKHGRIYVGTSGYSFPDWRGVFYPAGLPQNEWLTYYARHFAAVEVNATYYRLPPPSTFARMAERTPEGFDFWVKVPGEATHGDEALPPLMERFLEAVMPLAEAAKLRGALAQFPNSFHRADAGWERVVNLQEELKGLPLAVEFRRDEWYDDRTCSDMAARGMVMVAADMPDLPGLPRLLLRATAQVAYVRLHGRNQRNWYNPRLGDRYDYEYSPAELESWVSRVARLNEKTAATYVFFNNCHLGQAVKNAKMLRQLISDLNQGQV